MATTTERGLLMLSQLLMLPPTLRLRLIPGMATTERGLLMPSLLLRLLPTQRLRLIPGMDTTDTATDHTDMATTATDLTDMATITERGLLMPSLLLRLLPTQ